METLRSATERGRRPLQGREPLEVPEDASVLKLVSVILIELEDSWFRLPEPERRYLRREVFDILSESEGLSSRWLDADPWTGKGTEFMVCEFSDLQGYWKFWNNLRNHRMFSTPYARISRVSLGYERSLRTGLVET